MRIEHVALWTSDVARSKEYYERYFEVTAGPKYVNPVKQLETYFLSFQSGARLEIMSKPSLSAGQMDNQTCGWTHIALLVGTPQDVDRKADFLRSDGWLKDEPRWTGDGYYEAVAIDPDGNRIEIMADERKLSSQIVL